MIENELGKEQEREEWDKLSKRCQALLDKAQLAKRPDKEELDESH